MAGFPPEFNLIIKAGIIIVVLTFQSAAIVNLIGFLRSQHKSAANGAHQNPQPRQEARPQRGAGQ
jgi:simple sugar transport system permease protein